MSNISFDNPWLLLIAIPLLAAILIPFFITVRKDNANFHNITSVCLHAVIAICVTLAISGMAFEAVITDTQVYVLADVSYSANYNIDDVQSKVEKVAGKLPGNSKMGVIVFGRDYLRVSDLGDKVPNIRSAAEKIDRSATDIGAALRYAGNLFDDGVIKRIIVITDGVETVSTNNILSVVTALQENDIYIDAVFIDDNISEDTKEIQLETVEATSSTYLNKDESVSVLVRANSGKEKNGKAIESVQGYVNLYQNGTRIKRQPETFYNGLNAIPITLPTDEVGTFNYEVTVETVNPDGDTSPYNNVGYFTQKVTDERNVLFIGGTMDDVTAGQRIYGTDGVNYVTEISKIPLSVEDMCNYDEIVLSNFDVRTIRAYDMFMTGLETLVNDYGKTLTTYGNTYVQADDPDNPHPAIKRLSGLLPVRVGNYDQDQRLVAIVLDVSVSMNYNEKLGVAKRAAIELINILNNTDTVMVVGFSSVIEEFQPAVQLTARKVVIEKIEEKTTENGTSLSGALIATHKMMPTRYHDKQVIVITDGLSNGSDYKAANAEVKAMTDKGIVVSALSVYPDPEDHEQLDKMINDNATSDDAFYQRIENEKQIDVIFRQLSEDTQQVRIDETGVLYEVTLRRPDDEVAQGVSSIDAIDGFWYSAAKTQATTVLTAKYWRDKVASFDVPIYVYWNGGGKGKVVSFLSDIASDWTDSWSVGTDGGKFLSNIPAATLPSERITTPFLVEVEGKGNSTAINVQTPASMQGGTKFSAVLTDPNGMITERELSYVSGIYLATFSTDAPGTYSLHLTYEGNGVKYESDTDFSVAYYAEYDCFTSYSSSYLYRLKSENGKILDLDKISSLENSAEYTTYMFSFTMPLMIAIAALFVIDIIIRQLKWQDIVSFFSGLFRRRSK
ncbi:MAG: VWA domain-containing protein [Clostridiales bacterium]|nr:VWA domain-containing protein [Clostridiales bacterium]